MYLASYRTPHSGLSEFVESVIAEARSFGLSAEHLRRLSDRLLRLLRLDSLRLRSKVLELAFESAQIFQSGRVLTDLRPVFSLVSGMDIEGMMVLHTLKIEYFTGEGTKETYVSMDDDDMAQLAEALERATQKAAALRAFIKKSRLADLSLGGSAEND